MKYASFIDQRVLQKTNQQLIGSYTWKDKFFSHTIKFVFSIGTLFLLCGITIECLRGHMGLAFVDIIAFLAVAGIALHKKLDIATKKSWDMGILALFILFKMIALSSLIYASLFLLIFSVLATLLFHKTIAYVSLAFNCLATALFFIAQKMGIVDHELADTAVKVFVVRELYAINFIFINTILVVFILYVTSSFESTMAQLERLMEKVQAEVQEKERKNEALREIESNYRRLFFLNPLPMFVYHPETLSMMQANLSAIMCYGYTKSEFLKLNLRKILNQEEIPVVFLPKYKPIAQRELHYHKNGKPFTMDTKSSEIILNGRRAILSIMRDVTSESAYLKEIEEQNKKMREIAHIQCHGLRAPLAKILALVNLLFQDKQIVHSETEKTLTYLKRSADELDRIIKDIIKRTELDK